MNLIIEIIDGVAYAVADGGGCNRCVLKRVCDIDRNCFGYLKPYHYRRLTAEEREEVIKAMGRGIE